MPPPAASGPSDKLRCVILRSFLAMAAVFAAWPAAASTTRPDRDDAAYVEPASKHPSSIALAASVGNAVLIAPPQAAKLKTGTYPIFRMAENRVRPGFRVLFRQAGN